MRKVLLVLAFTVGLAGCSSWLQTMQLVTASYSNPVTPQMLYTAENTLTVVFAALETYKATCVKKVIADNCRATVRQIQVYTRQLPVVLTSTRDFVKNNDQVNAVIAYNKFVELYNQLKAIAVTNKISGVN